MPADLQKCPTSSGCARSDIAPSSRRAGWRVRSGQGEGPLVALLRLVSRNKRRYGGYLVHLGVLLMLVGITGQSIYQQRQQRVRENMFLLLKNQEIGRRNEFIRYISATIGHLSALTRSPVRTPNGASRWLPAR